ncbi:hypothetical protein C8J56DRAFT_1085058 [Mycena floridula]|nr:hypothetical protein C8J56DRAFT_1085058 [Mycena floridula]
MSKVKKEFNDDQATKRNKQPETIKASHKTYLGIPALDIPDTREGRASTVVRAVFKAGVGRSMGVGFLQHCVKKLMQSDANAEARLAQEFTQGEARVKQGWSKKRSLQFLGDVTKGDNVTRDFFFTTAAAAAVNNGLIGTSSTLKSFDTYGWGQVFDTLLLAHRFRPIHIQLRDCPPEDQPPDQELFLVQKAWEIQTDGNCRVPTMAIDVDCEAIQALEEAMFTDSAIPMGT